MQRNKNLQYLVENVPKYRIVGLQGSARSGKTYSVLQYLISLAYKYHIGIISVCRESYNALKATAMRDFFDILTEAGMYNEDNYHRTDHTYTINGNVFEFFGLDSPGKVQGRKRDILFVNEIMETDERIYRQLVIRTTGKIIFDYNPTQIEHWVYNEIARDDATMLISTYLDNPHLNAETIAEIEYTERDYQQRSGIKCITIGSNRVINKLATLVMVWTLDFSIRAHWLRLVMLAIQFNGMRLFISQV
jgi:phage terminase large subunit